MSGLLARLAVCTKKRLKSVTGTLKFSISEHRPTRLTVTTSPGKDFKTCYEDISKNK